MGRRSSSGPSVTIALYLAAAKSYGSTRAASPLLITSFIPVGQKVATGSMAFLVAFDSICDFSFFMLHRDNELAEPLQ